MNVSLLPESTEDSCQKGCRWPETPRARFQTGRGTSSNSPDAFPPGSSLLIHIGFDHPTCLVVLIPYAFSDLSI